MVLSKAASVYYHRERLVWKKPAPNTFSISTDGSFWNGHGHGGAAALSWDTAVMEGS